MSKAKAKRTRRNQRRSVEGLKLDLEELQSLVDWLEDENQRLQTQTERLGSSLVDFGECIEQFWMALLVADGRPTTERRRRSDARGLFAVLNEAHRIQRRHKTVRYLTAQELDDLDKSTP